MTTETSKALESILAAERARCEATGDRDYDRLASLLAEDLTHIHMNGNTQDKETYMAGVKALKEASKRERGELNVRIYNDVAIMVGPQFNVAADGSRTEMQVTQVWRQIAGEWKQSSFHACRVTPRTT